MANRGKKSAVYGELVVGGTGSPVAVLPPLQDKAGYAPEVLDPVIATLVGNAEAGAEVLQEAVPLLKAVMMRLKSEINVLLTNLQLTKELDPNAETPPPDLGGPLAIVLGLADKASQIMQRLQKMNADAVKSADDATRLRSFLATGDEETEGLKSLGEQQLRRMVLDTAQGLNRPDDAA